MNAVLFVIAALLLVTSGFLVVFAHYVRDAVYEYTE